MSKNFPTDKFLTAQAPVIDEVLAELSTGRKRTHWMWFIFPHLDRADFKAMLGLIDRLAKLQVSALIKRCPLLTDSPYGQVRLGVPQHVLRFYFPKFWSEAEAQT